MNIEDVIIIDDSDEAEIDIDEEVEEGSDYESEDPEIITIEDRVMMKLR